MAKLAELPGNQPIRRSGVMGYPTTGVDNGVEGDTFLVSPPFIITEAEIDTAFDLLDDALTAFEKEFLGSH